MGLTTQETTMTSKRPDAISWDDYFMGVAVLSSQRSKDPNSQVGACVVSRRNTIVGTGYNGFPVGCSDDALPWSREADSPYDTKYPYVCCAEMNAIVNTNAAGTAGCRIYTTLFPCSACAKLIIQSGITRVIFLADKYHDSDTCRAARRMFDMAGVAYAPFVATTERLTIDFT
jgi:dCMP deaminase